MPTALFLSPHLDDAVFSAGGTLAAMLDAGWRVELVTVFTASVANPTPFALTCQTDKGLSPEVDYMAVRRAEDLAAAAALGLDARHVHHLDLPEAPHRGYRSAADLFAGMHADDEATADRVADAVRPWVDAAVRGAGADRVLWPACLGHHADHLLVDRAVRRLGPRGQRWRWRDTPYVMRHPGPRPEMSVDIAATLTRKLAACTCYTTQLGFQFGGEAAMRERLTMLARAEAKGHGLAERFYR